MRIQRLPRNLSPSASQAGSAPEIDLNALAPYWAFRHPRPLPWTRDENLGLGEGMTPTTDVWLVWYEADEDPDLDVPAWTEFLFGAISHGCVSSIFMIIDNTPGGWLYYEINLPTLDNYAGTDLETRIRVDDTSGGVNQGACLSIFDGTYQFAVWMRRTGLNLDGLVDYPHDMGDWHRVRLTAQGATCHLYLDGQPIQTAPYMNTTVSRKVAFGTFVQL